MKATNFSPNSIRVSLRYCPGFKRLMSPLVMLTAPVPVGGYTRMLPVQVSSYLKTMKEEERVIQFITVIWRSMPCA
jgi:hypothetical protein